MALVNPRRCGHFYDDGTTNHGMNRSGGVAVFEVENRSPPLGYACRSATDVMLKRIRQFKIRHLLAAASLVAVLCALLLPFDPAVTFNLQTRGQYTDPDGTLISMVVIEVRNEGHFPLWYPGWSQGVTDYAVIGERSTGAGQEKYSVGAVPREWSLLMPGATTNVRLPLHPNCTVYKIGLTLQDWRGRELTRWSRKIDPASLNESAEPSDARESPS